MADLKARPKPPYLYVNESHPLGRGLVLYHPVNPSHDGTGLGVTGWCPRSPDLASGAWDGAASPRDFIRTRFGYASQHLGQDGSGHFKLGTDDIGPLTSMTIGAIIRIPNQGFGSLEPNGAIIAKAASGSLTEWSLGFTASGFDDVRPRFYVRTDTTSLKDITHQSTCPKTEWIAMYGIWDGANITMYLNKVPSSGSTAISGALRQNTYEVTLGSRKSAISSWFVASADIAGVWIWDRDLTKEEIHRHQDDPFGAHFWMPSTVIPVTGSDTIEIVPAELDLSIPAPSLAASSTVTVTPVNLETQPQPATLSASSVVSVTPATLQTQAQNVAITSGATITLEPVVLSLAAQSVGLAASSSISVDPATLHASAPAVGLTAASSVAIDPVSLTVSAQPIGISIGTVIEITPATIQASIPAVGLSASGAVAITPVELQSSVPSVSLASSATIQIQPTTLALEAPAVELGIGTQLGIAPATLELTVPAVSVTASATITLEPVSLVAEAQPAAMSSTATVAVTHATLDAFVPAAVLSVPLPEIVDPDQSTAIPIRSDASTIPAASKSVSIE